MMWVRRLTWGVVPPPAQPSGTCTTHSKHIHVLHTVNTETCSDVLHTANTDMYCMQQTDMYCTQQTLRHVVMYCTQQTCTAHSKHRQVLHTANTETCSDVLHTANTDMYCTQQTQTCISHSKHRHVLHTANTETCTAHRKHKHVQHTDM